jgi:ATP-dependent protease Clp ATPase subunit
MVLMNSPSNAICNECIELLHDILREEEKLNPPEPRSP